MVVHCRLEFQNTPQIWGKAGLGRKRTVTWCCVRGSSLNLELHSAKAERASMPRSTSGLQDVRWECLYHSDSPVDLKIHIYFKIIIKIINTVSGLITCSKVYSFQNVHEVTQLRRFHNLSTVMLCLTMGRRSEKRVGRWFHCVRAHRAHTHTHQDGLAHCTPSYTAQPIAPRPQSLQHVTVLNPVGNCNIMVSIYVSQHRKSTVKTGWEKMKNSALTVNGVGKTGSCLGWVSEWVVRGCGLERACTLLQTLWTLCA